jgi:signal transduction histidine kinase
MPELAHADKLARRARQVRAEQVRSVYLQSPFTTAGSLIAGALLIVGMWGQIALPVLIGWGVALCAHQALRVKHYLAYLRAGAEEKKDEKWGRLYTAAATTAGFIWGSAGFLMFVSDSVPHQAFLSLVLYGIALVSMTSLSAYAPAFYALIPLTLVPFVVRMLLEPGAIHLYIAAPGVIVLGMALALGRNVNRLITETLTKRFENLELIEELSQQTALAERARLEAEAANRSKTQFFAAASHDLRQPLHAMALFAGALNERIHDPETKAIVESINASVAALESFFDELLDISKIDAGVLKPELSDFPVSRVLERVRANFEAAARDKGLELRLRPSTRYVYSDSMLLERILCNLVSNAIRYTNNGGVLVGCRRRGRQLRLEVWDSGVGIPEDKREKIFEEFYQIGNPERSRTKGMGLGLSIVRRLCQLLGYEINLASRPRRGSVFRFDVPVGVSSRAVPRSDAVTAPAPRSLAGRLIVVIDDEAAIVEGMRLLLTGWGAEVLYARSSDDIVEEVSRVGVLPDLIIADYQLASGTTGIQVIDGVRKALDPEIPALLVTGSTLPERMKEAADNRCEVMTKPVVPERLRQLVESMILRRKI